MTNKVDNGLSLKLFGIDYDSGIQLIYDTVSHWEDGRTVGFQTLTELSDIELLRGLL